METINNESNLQTIYSTEAAKTYGFPKAEIILVSCLLTVGVTSLKSEDHQNEGISFSNKINNNIQEIAKIDHGAQTLYNLGETIENRNEVSDMSKVTQKDLNDTERYFDDKINGVRNEISSLKSDINDIKVAMTKISDDVNNLPDKIKANKWETILKSFIAPVMTAALVGLISYLLKN